MKSQTRFVLISVVGIVLVVAGLIYAASEMIGFDLFRSGRTEQRSESPSRVFDARANALVELDSSSVSLEGIEKLYVFGGWDLTVREGSEPSLTVRATERIADRIDLSASGDTLGLEVERNTNYVNVKIEATLVVPEITDIDIDGAADLEISGFDQERLAIDVAGASNVEVYDSRFENVLVDVAGAANVDLSESVAVNVEVDLDGAANVELFMDGGRLTGTLDGLGQVTYRGEVLEETIDVDGLGSVDRR